MRVLTHLNYLDKLHAKLELQPTNISLQQMVNFCKKKNIETLIHSANFLKNELPVRYARQFHRLERLPLGLGMTNSLMNVKSWHYQTFREIEEFGKIVNENDEERFTLMLKNIYERHSPLLFSLSKGIYELKEKVSSHYNENFPLEPITFNQVDFAHTDTLQTRIHYFLTSRIGIRMLIGQHIEIHNQIREKLHIQKEGVPSERHQPHPHHKSHSVNHSDRKFRKSTSDDNHHPLQDSDNYGDDEYVGMICIKTKPYEVAKHAIDDAAFVCEREYGVAPKVILEGVPSFSFPYIPSHVYYILFELLKNSMEATIAHHKKESLPPIKIIIADGESNEDCSIRISDEGGGMARSQYDKAWGFAYSTKSIDLSSFESVSDFTLSQPMSGLGVGLTVSRLYCRYFGGDLRLVPMEGYGTDAYIYLHRLMEKREPPIPLH